jgi:hypothetical protein
MDMIAIAGGCVDMAIVRAFVIGGVIVGMNVRVCMVMAAIMIAGWLMRWGRSLRLHGGSFCTSDACGHYLPAARAR